MKILVTFISLAIVHLSYGQSANEKDLVAILNVALLDNQLPGELIIKANPKIASWTNDPFIVIKSDKNKNLERLQGRPENSHVWIMDYTEIFELNIPCGLIPISIVRKKDQLIFDYKTVKYPQMDSTSTSCHSGKLIAQRKDNTWTVVSSKMKNRKCEIDFFGRNK
jgi:hypothetical protein